MTAIYYADMPLTWVRAQVARRVAHTDHLMITVMDFDDGPQTEPDPPHAHPHEQVTYVAEGQILFFIEGQATPLTAGDVFTVPSGKPHSIQLISAHVRLIDCFTPIREDFLEPPQENV